MMCAGTGCESELEGISLTAEDYVDAGCGVQPWYSRREEAHEMILHAWRAYMDLAHPWDELKPLLQTKAVGQKVERHTRRLTRQFHDDGRGFSGHPGSDRRLRRVQRGRSTKSCGT